MSEHERERCCKQGCSEHAVIVLKIYTDGDDMYLAFCKTHLLTSASVIETIVQGLISGELVEDAEEGR